MKLRCLYLTSSSYSQGLHLDILSNIFALEYPHIHPIAEDLIAKYTTCDSDLWSNLQSCHKPFVVKVLWSGRRKGGCCLHPWSIRILAIKKVPLYRLRIDLPVLCGRIICHFGYKSINGQSHIRSVSWAYRRTTSVVSFWISCRHLSSNTESGMSRAWTYLSNWFY